LNFGLLAIFSVGVIWALQPWAIREPVARFTNDLRTILRHSYDKNFMITDANIDIVNKIN